MKFVLSDKQPGWIAFMKNAALVAASMVLCLGLVEMGLRVAGISYPSFYQADPRRGYCLRPGASGWYNKEGNADIEINTDGLRDREHTVSKSTNTLRIAILGDSFSEAKQVPLDDTFWSVMQQEFEVVGESGNNTVEVINFGVSGYGTAQELLTLRHHVWKYEPDHVLLTFSTGNDVRDNYRPLRKMNNVPYIVFHDGQEVVDDSFKQTTSFRFRLSLAGQLFYRLINYSHILQMANEARNVWKKRTVRGDRAAQIMKSQPETAGTDGAIYREPAVGPWLEAWEITEQLILLMRDETTVRNAGFHIVTLSNAEQVHPDPLVRKHYMNKQGVDDLYYPDKRIKDLGERESIPVLNLAPPLRDHAKKNQVFLHGFENTPEGTGHWNRDAHRLAGVLIARWLMDSIAGSPPARK